MIVGRAVSAREVVVSIKNRRKIKFAPDQLKDAVTDHTLKAASDVCLWKEFRYPLERLFASISVRTLACEKIHAYRGASPKWRRAWGIWVNISRGW